MTPRPRARGTRLVGSLLVVGALALGGCSGSGGEGSAGAGATSAAGAATASDPAGVSSGASPADPGAPTGAPVNCSGTSCSVTLTGDVTSVDVLGTRVTFGGVHDGQATIGVGGRQLSCRQGEAVSAGPLRLECTTVQPDRVTLTAGLGG